MRIGVMAIAICVLASCAPYKQDESSETSYYDSRTSTGSNIPKKGSAIIVDKSVVADQIGRQGGSPVR